LKAAAIFRMSRMSRTSIVRAALRMAATADTVVIVVEIAETVADAEDVLVVADADVVAAVDEAVVVDVTAVAMAGTVAGGTKPFRHGSARITKSIERAAISVAALFVLVNSDPGISSLRSISTLEKLTHRPILTGEFHARV